jgi:xanthine/CO dehydrogenase XdhC/CoxF family maturation factor
MTHEFKKLVQAYQQLSESGRTAVIVTVVALEGTSYRRPGVRMLIFDDGRMIGAVSGGCVEKEILRQSESVFRNGIPKVMTYDGRYRLGCEGILYILIEPFRPSKEFSKAFGELLEGRIHFRLITYFNRQEVTGDNFGSLLVFNEISLPLRPGFQETEGLEIFEETLTPCFKLMILGAEHDAVQLCSFASLIGWEVDIIATPAEEKDVADFPGARQLINTLPESLEVESIDKQTAVVLMTHSYVKDLKYLLSLKDSRPAYLGLLGPATRREKLLNEFLEHCPEVSEEFFDGIHGPAGLNIGAETPQEIAIAVIAEILATISDQEPMRLKNKKGAIHS